MVRLFLCAATLCFVVTAQDTKFLLMSSTRLSKVSYVALPMGGPDSLTEPLKPQPLIETGLKSPGGICWHPAMKTLYIADGAAGVIYKYKVGFSGSSMHIVGSQEMAVTNLPGSKWVGCDVMGNLYVTDEDGKKITKVQTQNVMLGKNKEKPLILYSSATVSAMGAPNGIVVDNFRMYWADDAGGKGTVMAGLLTPPDTDAAATARAFAVSDGSVDGVCITPKNLIFTGTEQTEDGGTKGSVFGVRKAGDGIVTEIADTLKGPAGCAWDGDGTVYVADSVGNAVMAVPSNMDVISKFKITKAVDFEDATSLVVISGSMQSGLTLTLVAIVMSLMM